MKRILLLSILTAVSACGGDGEGGGSGGGGGGSGLDPFDDNVLATYEISMSAADWTAMTSDLQNESDTWRTATITWRGEVYPNVAIQPAGQSSREPGIANPNKPSMWVSFNEFVPGREFHKYERIKLDSMLDDPAMLRERLAYPIYVARGVAAPKVAHCRVMVNGVYRGLYMVEERVNKEFCTKRFDKTVVNQLYRWTEAQPDVIYDPSKPPRFYAAFDTDNKFAMWEARIETVGDNAAEVQNLVRLINENPAAAGSVFDVDKFLNWMAVEVATGETDGYVGSSWLGGGVGDPKDFYTGNIFMYKVPGSNLFQWIVWDRDQAFWRDEADITFGFQDRIVTRRLILDIPGNLDRFKSYLREVVDGPALPATLEARFEFIKAQIKDAAYEDPFKKAPDNQSLEWEWDDVKRFFGERRTKVLSQL